MANPGSAKLVRALMVVAGVAMGVLLVGGGGVFLLFLRGIARLFGNKRLAMHIVWYLIFFALSPALALGVLLLFYGTGKLLTLLELEPQGADHVIYTVVTFTLTAAVLAGFLLMLREVRNTIERAIVAAKLS
jgi:hypothetical protein